MEKYSANNERKNLSHESPANSRNYFLYETMIKDDKFIIFRLKQFIMNDYHLKSCHDSVQMLNLNIKLPHASIGISNLSNWLMQKFLCAIFTMFFFISSLKLISNILKIVTRKVEKILANYIGNNSNRKRWFWPWKVRKWPKICQRL